VAVVVVVVVVEYGGLEGRKKKTKKKIFFYEKAQRFGRVMASNPRTAGSVPTACIRLPAHISTPGAAASLFVASAIIK
jgi:hypothetical protein